MDFNLYSVNCFHVFAFLLPICNCGCFFNFLFIFGCIVVDVNFMFWKCRKSRNGMISDKQKNFQKMHVIFPEKVKYSESYDPFTQSKAQSIIFCSILFTDIHRNFTRRNHHMVWIKIIRNSWINVNFDLHMHVNDLTLVHTANRCQRYQNINFKLNHFRIIVQRG